MSTMCYICSMSCAFSTTPWYNQGNPASQIQSSETFEHAQNFKLIATGTTREDTLHLVTMSFTPVYDSHIYLLFIHLCIPSVQQCPLWNQQIDCGKSGQMSGTCQLHIHSCRDTFFICQMLSNEKDHTITLYIKPIQQCSHQAFNFVPNEMSSTCWRTKNNTPACREQYNDMSRTT